MSEWISVKNRVPKSYEVVLVCNIDSKVKSNRWVCAGQINNEGYWCNQFDDSDHITVTHWMPLPEPPKN